MTLTVIAHTKSKKPRIVEREPGVFDIYVSQAAESGKANGAITKALARHLGIGVTSVSLIRGFTSKTKRFRIIGTPKL
jgi:uncharacterized protein